MCHGMCMDLCLSDVLLLKTQYLSDKRTIYAQQLSAFGVLVHEDALQIRF